MKIYVASDLHVESSVWSFDLSDVEFDVCVFAGDVGNAVLNGVSFLNKNLHSLNEKPVVYVMGNHEYYGSNIEDELKKAKKNCLQNKKINLLHRNEVQIDGVRFLGCTLWTDFKFFGEDRMAEAARAAERCINDYACIYYRGRRLTPNDTFEFHMNDLEWLTEKLNEKFDGKTVVVTHHLPSALSVADNYANDIVTAAFASRLDDLISSTQPDLWVHGHTHHSCDYQIGRTRVVCNPKGYGPRSVGGRFENDAEFDGSKVIEL